MTRPEEDVEIGATASSTVGALGATSDVFDVAATEEVVAEEDKLFEVVTSVEEHAFWGWGHDPHKIEHVRLKTGHTLEGREE